MDAALCETHLNSQSWSLDAGNRGSVAVTHGNMGITSVEGVVTEEFKSTALQAFLSKPEKIPMKLRSAVNLPLSSFSKMLKVFKKADRQEEKERVAENYINEVFAKAGIDKQLLTNIKGVLGIQDVGGVHQQDASASEEPPQEITESDYIKSLDDRSLNLNMKDEGSKYDMGSGSYTYKFAEIKRYNRLSDQADTSISRYPSSQHKRNKYGMVTQSGCHSTKAAQDILRTGLDGDKPFVNGDEVAIRTFQQFDKHAYKMLFLLKSLDRAIHCNGLPAGVKVLAIKVAVGDGYRASHVLKVQKVKDGVSSSTEQDPDNLVVSDNLLRITFNSKSDMAELFTEGRDCDLVKPSGKTLGDLERNKQVKLTLESKCNDAIQDTIISQCRVLAISSEVQFENSLLKVSTKTYTFNTIGFDGPVGGGDV